MQSDRTQTIRASVADVQTALLITVGLVVGVIFAFLRSVRGTVIPAVTVPLSLVATFAAMDALGFSLDNLSLMALAIAAGFVVDDAIVMLENIHRHIEEGMAPRAAAIRGAGEIGFTIVSISLSLIAVFIPLFLMSGIIGRLFREFAVTISAAILASTLVSLTLTPMMCARLLRPEAGRRHGALHRAAERVFEALLAGYRRTPDVALRHHRVTFVVFLLTVAATGVAFLSIPKGFFPPQDTGLIIGQALAAPDASFREMSGRMQAFAEIVQHDPGVATVAMSAGAAPARPPTRGGCSSPSSPARNATPAPSGSSNACARSSPAWRARYCCFSRRRTSPWVAAPRPHSTSTRCRTPTRPSSTPGTPRPCRRRRADPKAGVAAAPIQPRARRARAVVAFWEVCMAILPSLRCAGAGRDSAGGWT